MGSAPAVDGGTDSETTDSVSPYDRPRRPRRALGAELGAGGAAELAVRGTEVVQVIQALDNRVRLVAGKPTVVRVYLDVDAFSAPTTVTGELTWRRGNGGVSFLAAMNRVLVDPANRPNLQQQRFDIAKSLNFILPPTALTGTLTLRVNRVNVVGGQTLTLAAQPVTTVTFIDSTAIAGQDHRAAVYECAHWPNHYAAGGALRLPALVSGPCLSGRRTCGGRKPSSTATCCDHLARRRRDFPKISRC